MSNTPGTAYSGVEPRDAALEPLSEAQRFYSLDAVRGAMMLLGIFYHASTAYYYLFARGLVTAAVRNAQTHRAILYLDRGMHIFRMPVFFVVAGFFGALLYTRFGHAGFVANRTRRVLAPLLVAWILLVPAINAGVLFAAAARSPRPLTSVIVNLRSWQFYDHSLHHLWFLYHLMIFYGVALVAIWVGRQTSRETRARARSVFRRIVGSSWRTVLLAIPTILILETMPRGDVARDLAFAPDLRILLVYCLFFGFGWLLYGSRDLLPGLARKAWLKVTLAILLFPVFLIVYGRGPRGSLAHLVTSSTDALITWLCVFGIIGLAVRYLDRPNPTIRYLSNASYWIYLAHYPLVIWIAGALGRVDMPGALKILVNVLASVSILLIGYHYAVRNTVIGMWLNGKRPQPAPPVEPSWSSVSRV